MCARVGSGHFPRRKGSGKYECGKRQQELDRCMSHRVSWDEAWKSYAARVFHNWSKEARGIVLPRSVYWGFSLGSWKIRGADAPYPTQGSLEKGKRKKG
jgi:hypothetical protein